MLYYKSRLSVGLAEISSLDAPSRYLVSCMFPIRFRALPTSKVLHDAGHNLFQYQASDSTKSRGVELWISTPVYISGPKIV